MNERIYYVDLATRQDLIPDNASPQERAAISEYLIKSDYVWAGVVDDEILGFWGLYVPTLVGDRAYIWFQGLTKLSEHKFTFARHSRDVIKEILGRYPHIYGHCVRSDRDAQRWLWWLGATFIPTTEDLIEFEIKA